MILKICWGKRHGKDMRSELYLEAQTIAVYEGEGIEKECMVFNIDGGKHAYSVKMENNSVYLMNDGGKTIQRYNW